MKKKFHLTLEILHEYVYFIRDEKFSPRSSIYDYLVLSGKISSEDQCHLTLKDIDFSKRENKIDLSHANLSGVKFKNVNFSGKHLVIHNANLEGCWFLNSSFTDQIALTGTKFGQIELTKEVFKDAEMRDADYIPSSSDVIYFPVTQSVIDNYLSHDLPRPNLNDFINQRYGYIYSERTDIVSMKTRPQKTLIADLSGHIIDERFSKVDISGSNLTNATIKGRIENIRMRDCKTRDTVFDSDCYLIAPDLRGTSLAASGILLSNNFSAVSYENTAILESPILSLHSNLSKLDGYAINLSSDSRHTLELGMIISGTPVFDPCYYKNEPDNKRIARKFTREDLIAYGNYARVLDNPDDFITYIKREKGIEGNIYADFSGQNLQNNNFSYGVFKHCDFTRANLNGANFTSARVSSCNFTCATTSSSYISSQRSFVYNVGQTVRNVLPESLGQYFPTDKPAILDSASFKNCDFTWADFTNAYGHDVTIENVMAVNFNAPNLQLSGYDSRIVASNLSGAYIPNLSAKESRIEGSDFSSAVMTSSTIVDSDITNSDFSGTDLSYSKISRTRDNQHAISSIGTDSKTNLEGVHIGKGVDVQLSKIAGKTTPGKLSFKRVSNYLTGQNVDLIIEEPPVDCDLSNLQHSTKYPPQIDTSRCIENDVNHEIEINRAQQNIEKNRQKYYNRVGMAIIIGIVIVSAVCPPVLAATLPAAVVATVMPTVINAALIGSLVVSGTVGMELMFRNYMPKIITDPVRSVYNGITNIYRRARGQQEIVDEVSSSYSGFSIIRPIARLVGVDRMVARANRHHIDRRNMHQAQLDQRREANTNARRNEETIIAHEDTLIRDQRARFAQIAANNVLRRARTLSNASSQTVSSNSSIVSRSTRNPS